MKRRPSPCLPLCLCMAMLWLAAAGTALAQARSVPPAPQTEFVQHLNGRLPLQSEFIDDDGRPKRLTDLFGKVPVVLVPGYFHCPNLCSTLMEGVLQTVALMDLSPKAYRLLAVSIDPTETAALAARKKQAYRPMLGEGAADLHLLTGKRPDIERLMSAAGFQYVYDPSLQQYVHPSGFLIATPDGRISKYFLGVRFEPAQVRQALQEASAGAVGSPVERLLLLCAHYDPQTGKYTLTAMTAVRIVGLAVLALLAAWIWRHRRQKEGL